MMMVMLMLVMMVVLILLVTTMIMLHPLQWVKGEEGHHNLLSIDLDDPRSKKNCRPQMII